MPPVNSVGTCEECHKMFEYTLLHSGVTNSCYAYCEGCGTTAILDISDGRFPIELIRVAAYKVIVPDLERHLKPCSCGSRFTANAAPQCPHCRQALSPTTAAKYLETNISKGSPSRRWQMSWSGNYYIVIEGKQVRNNFKSHS
jgi:hypothetical protein